MVANSSHFPDKQ